MSQNLPSLLQLGEQLITNILLIDDTAVEKQENRFLLFRWEYFEWQGKGGDYFPDPNLKLTPGRIKPCSQIRVNVPEILYETFFPTSLSSRRTPPPFQATFYPVELWCSGRPVYQTAVEENLTLEADKDKDSGATGKEDVSKNGGVEGKGDNSQKDKIGDAVRGATTERGGRLLVRGGFWEVQVIFVLITMPLIKRVCPAHALLDF